MTGEIGSIAHALRPRLRASMRPRHNPDHLQIGHASIAACLVAILGAASGMVPTPGSSPPSLRGPPMSSSLARIQRRAAAMEDVSGRNFEAKPSTKSLFEYAPGPQATRCWREVDSNFRFRDALSSARAWPWSRRLIRPEWRLLE